MVDRPSLYPANEPKGPESKEVQKDELEKTRALCASYHLKLDKTKYFDSQAIKAADDLLSEFSSIKQNLLPPSVSLVVQHRLAYVRVMASFNSSPAIGEFLDSVKEHFGDMTLLTKSPQEIYELIRDNEKFKALSPLDFRQILSSLTVGIRALGYVNSASNANWDKEADSLIRPAGAVDSDDRVDDKTAAFNLQRGFENMQEFTAYAQQQRWRIPQS